MNIQSLWIMNSPQDPFLINEAQALILDQGKDAQNWFELVLSKQKLKSSIELNTFGYNIDKWVTKYLNTKSNRMSRIIQ